MRRASQVLEQIVRFDCERSFPESFPQEARALVLGLLDPNPATRIGSGPEGLSVLKDHPFFTDAGLDIDTLYKQEAPQLEAGSEAPDAEAGWARRQNSIMWSPMPAKCVRWAVIALAPMMAGDSAAVSRPLFVTCRFDLGVRSGGGKYTMDAIEEGSEEAGATFTASAADDHRVPRLPGRPGTAVGAPPVPARAALGLIAEE